MPGFRPAQRRGESDPANNAGPDDILIKEHSFVNPEGGTVEDRILVPEGYERINVKQGSFAEYLKFAAETPRVQSIVL